MQDTVKIGIDDRDCRGVTSSDGRFRYDAKDHVVEVPAHEASSILKTPLASKMRTSIAANRPVMEAHHAYEAYCEANGFTSYPKWYREHWKGAEA